MPLVCDRPCRARPIRPFVRRTDGLGAPGLPGDDTDSALPRRTTGSAGQNSLLPEAGNSGTVGGGQGL
jgi:hypothetical protein